MSRELKFRDCGRCGTPLSPMEIMYCKSCLETWRQFLEEKRIGKGQQIPDKRWRKLRQKWRESYEEEKQA